MVCLKPSRRLSKIFFVNDSVVALHAPCLMAGDFHSYSLRHPDQEKISSRTPSQIVDDRIDVLPVFAVAVSV